ncbi:hypothetical protein DM460_22730, partial [Brevibacillus laterosporus]
MYRKWVSSFLCVAILWTGLFTNVNVVGATEAPERNEEIRKTNEKDTKDWIIEEQEKVEQQEKEPTSTKGDVT